MDMYKILQSLQAIEKKTLNESVGSVLDEITSSEFDADALAKHKSRLAREKTRMGLSMPKPDGGPRKSDVPAAARAARGEEPLTLRDLEEADEDCPVTNAIVRRIMANRTDMLSKYGPAKILQAAEAVADSVGMVDEIGSSDVSGWVRQVEQELADQPVNEMTGKEIDYSTLEIDGIDYRDAPDFADAYFSDGYYTDGTQLSDQELDQLSNDGDLVYQYVEKMVYEDKPVNEAPVDYMKGPDSGAEITINGKPAVVLGEIPAQRGSATYYAVQYKGQQYPTRRDGGKTYDQVNVNIIYRDLPSFKNRTQQTEDDVGEGNEFAGKLAKARAIGAEEFEVDGKQYPVKESVESKRVIDINNEGKITAWLRKSARLPIDAPVYFDDSDLVWGSETIVDRALVNQQLTLGNLLKALKAAVAKNPTGDDTQLEGSGSRYRGSAQKDEKVAEGAKPDFLDLDQDGDKKEPMKQAAKDAKKGTAAKSSAAMKGMFGGDAKELTKDLKIREGYADFHDKKIAYQKIGATVDGSAQDYTVTFRDGKRKRYVEKNGRRQVMTLEPVDRQDDTDDEGNVVKRSRGRPAGTGRAMGAKGPTGRSKLMREQDIDLADRGEYDREGDMALNQLHQIADAAEELHSILDAEENLPEWVQSKITKAVDYLDTARDYLKAKKSQYQTRGEEPVAEKAVSRAQQQAAGAALAAKRGEGKAVGASKEMAKMSTKELEKYAGTKHNGLPDKKDESVHEVDTGEADARKTAPSSKKEQDRVFAKSRELAKKEKEDYDADNKDEVEETTTAGSVATGSDKPAKASGIYGKGVYEAAIAESFERKLSQQLNESISINASVSTEGGKNITVTATEEDADKLGELLKMAGLFSSGGYTQVDSQPETCQECGGHGGLHEGECSHRMDEEYANEPDETYSDMDTILNKLAGGLNRPKLQVNPNNPGDNPLAMKKLGKSAHSLNLGDLAEDIKSETRTRLMDLYKSYKQ